MEFVPLLNKLGNGNGGRRLFIDDMAIMQGNLWNNLFSGWIKGIKSYAALEIPQNIQQTCSLVMSKLCHTWSRDEWRTKNWPSNKVKTWSISIIHHKVPTEEDYFAVPMWTHSELIIVRTFESWNILNNMNLWNAYWLFGKVNMVISKRYQLLGTWARCHWPTVFCTL